MSKEIISTFDAPSAIGPYSQAVKSGNTLYVSGQIPIDPKTGELVCESIEKETKQVMENLKAILHAASFSLADVVKCSIFLKDMSDFALINEIYGSYFDSKYPARETVEVSRLPKDVKIEISCIAVKA